MSLPLDLRDGYQRFRQQRFELESERYRKMAKSQNPDTMIIGCADSRVDPGAIFSAGPGEIFTVRNVAAIVPPYEADGGLHGTSAEVEFAVNALGVKNIVVLGHGQCGGVAASLALAKNQPVGVLIEPWVNILAPARDELLSRMSGATPEELQRAMEFQAVKLSLSNLRTFPFVEEAISQNKLTLHGAWFSIGEAELRWWNSETDTFETLLPDLDGAG